MRTLLLIHCLLFATWCWADRSARSEFESFISEAERWPLITSRYRKDTGEIRLVYANVKAYETLAAGSINFPDGAVFVKNGYVTEDDPLFPSSAVPTNSKRTQVMLRDSKKYASTGGWGYALFEEGKPAVEWNAKTVKACFACHQVADSRGQIFSELMNLKLSKIRSAEKSGLYFKKEVVTKLGPEREELKKILNQHSNVWSRLHGEMNKHFFTGTFNELVPSLIAEVKKNERPAGFAPNQSTNFALVFRSKRKSSIECRNGEQAFVIAIKNAKSTSNFNKRKDLRFHLVCG